MTFKELRENAKITQRELSKELNIKQNTISNWENKKSNPKLKTISKLSKLLKVSEQEVLDCFK